MKSWFQGPWRSKSPGKTVTEPATTQSPAAARFAYVEDGNDDDDRMASKGNRQTDSGQAEQPGKQMKAELDVAAKRVAEAKMSADAIIAVMGLTGTGKSTFISCLTGGGVEIGHGLDSCTKAVGIHTFKYNGISIALIDTPGFDDTVMSDSEVLQSVAYFLSQLYFTRVKLAGIVYLHRIGDNKISGSALKNFHMFQALCGDSADLKHVVLATSMWDDYADNEERYDVAVRREKELRDSWWNEMIDFGSPMFRHDNTKESAMRIVNHILSIKGDLVLQIQREMGDHRCTLDQTLAGRVFQKDLLEERARHQKAFEDAQKSHAEAMRAGNERMMERIAKIERDHKEKLENLDRDKEAIRKDFERLQGQEQQKYQDMIERERRRYEEKEEKTQSELMELRRERKDLAAQMNNLSQQGWKNETRLKEELDKMRREKTDEAKMLAERYRQAAADLAAREKSSTFGKVVAVLAEVGVAAAGVMANSPAMAAVGSGLVGRTVADM